MKKQSEFLISKKVDHFEKWEGHRSKPKIKLNKEVKEELQSTKRVLSSNIVETPAIRERRAQIEALKDELQLLIISKDAYVDIKQDVSVQNRINELVNIKEVLKAEFDTKNFIRN